MKSTYSLDIETVETVEKLAADWNVSKTEVIRRAVRQAAEQQSARTPESRLESLRALQSHVKAQRTNLSAWKKTIREGHRL